MCILLDILKLSAFNSAPIFRDPTILERPGVKPTLNVIGGGHV